MTVADLFQFLAPRIAPAVEAKFGKNNLCVMSSKIAIEVGAYFGIALEPLTVRVVAYNEAFARHICQGFEDIGDVQNWAPLDGSHSIGIGFNREPVGEGNWNGHLIVTGGGMFGDFSVRQLERPQHGMLTGPGIFGPYSRSRQRWSASNKDGIHIEYMVIADESYRRSPDWKDKERRRSIIGALIRECKHDSATGCFSAAELVD